MSSSGKSVVPVATAPVWVVTICFVFPTTNEASILFKVPASDINSSSVEAGAVASSVCAEITSVFSFAPVTALSLIVAVVTLPADGAFVWPTMFK